MTDLSHQDRLRQVADSLRPLVRQKLRLNKYIKQFPTTKQAVMLMAQNVEELFYGGAAGPGKSSGLLMDALSNVHIPGYASLLLRQTYQDLAQPGALMERAQEWLTGTDARWSEIDHRWYFPNGATLSFGYLKGPRSHLQYQGAEFQMVGFDELTQFPEHQYLYLHSRIRKPDFDPDLAPDHKTNLLAAAPLKMRAASNPGDIGHEWVKKRFIDERTRAKGVVFIPGLFTDNPHLNLEEYDKRLQKLDPVTRNRLRKGDWDIQEEGELFKRAWFNRIERERVPAKGRTIRYWDLASTKKMGTNNPDWTVGVLMRENSGEFYIMDVNRFQGSPKDVEDAIVTQAEWDGEDVDIFIEQEGGASGKLVAHHFRTNLLPGYSVKFIPQRQNKEDRARPLSSATEARNVYMVIALWNEAYLDELTVFPNPDFHDDQVDASSGAHIHLSRHRRKIRVTSA